MKTTALEKYLKKKSTNKEKLRKIAEKWKRKLEKVDHIHKQTLSSLNWNWQGKESDSPLLCLHDHCKFWQKKTVINQLRKENTLLQNKLEEVEEEF